MGARLHELGEDQVNIVHDIDRRTFLILHRLIAVCQLFLSSTQRTEKEPAAKPIPKLDREITQLGHDPIPWGHRTMCQLCFMQWGPQHRNNVINRGACPQASPWTNIPQDLHNPWKLPPNTGLLWRGKPVHPSHSIVYYRGAITATIVGTTQQVAVLGNSRALA